MRSDWMMLVACGAWLTLLPLLVRFRTTVLLTSMRQAWLATCIAWSVWFVVLVTSALSVLTDWAACLWYFAAVTALVPPIAVLGARTPINRAWSWFVLVPLVLVLSWPIMPVVWSGAVHRSPFDLETPLLLGYLLVLVMGTGNYLGLSHTVSAILYMLGPCLVVLPFCPATAGWVPAVAAARAWAAFSFVAAGWFVVVQIRNRERRARSSIRLDLAFADFRELFGIVWTRRLLERFNDDARRQSRELRLEIHGVTTVKGVHPGPEVSAAEWAAAEQSFRWLLQKFVTVTWLDARLSGDGPPHNR
ncbi:MAG: hypothetical protein JSS02_06950 [Planctomycetes bacterium]|nr:hypothetical protein [Planctomycetota bacterium]